MSSTTVTDSLAIQTYYDRFTFQTINDRVKRKLRKQADELAEKIVSEYDFSQHITKTFGDKIIITSVLTKKKPHDKGKAK